MKRNISESKIVIRAPIHIGIPKRIFIAIEEAMTSYNLF
jgi:hypothetical protein